MDLKNLKYSSTIRTWIGVTSLMGFGDTIQCFVDYRFLANRLFINAPNEVSGLAARCYGVLMLVTATLHFLCAMDIHNKMLYHTAVFSYTASTVHFLLEIFWYKTMSLTTGAFTPLLISGLSVIGMVLGYRYIESDTEVCNDIEEFKGKKLSVRRKKKLSG